MFCVLIILSWILAGICKWYITTDREFFDPVFGDYVKFEKLTDQNECENNNCFYCTFYTIFFLLYWVCVIFFIKQIFLQFLVFITLLLIFFSLLFSWVK
jgi:hypothetical protein